MTTKKPAEVVDISPHISLPLGLRLSLRQLVEHERTVDAFISHRREQIAAMPHGPLRVRAEYELARFLDPHARAPHLELVDAEIDA